MQAKYQHILVAHDLDEDADAALDHAIDLARLTGARVTVLHAYEIASLGAPEVLVLAADWTREIGAASRERLDAVVARVRDSGVPIAGELREGSPWREVAAFAGGHGVDLVVVGTHGRRGVPRAILGSIAEKIVRTAPCPVLVVRPRAA